MEQKAIEKLVRKAMRRDDAALEKLLGMYQEYLYRIAYAYQKNEQAALDAVSECVAKVYVNLPKLREPRYFKTWMTRILLNEVLDEGKKTDKLLSLEALHEQGFAPEILEEGISREAKMDLYQALDNLSKEYRKVLILKYFNDMRVKDIARIMEIPEGTVKVLLYRGRKKLRTVFVEEMGYEESGL